MDIELEEVQLRGFLTGERVSRWEADEPVSDPHGGGADSSPLSCAFNLANSVVGIGLLSLPFSATKSGILGISLVLITICAVSTKTFSYIVEAGDVLKSFTFRNVEKKVFPRLGWIGEAAAFGNCYLINIAYFITIGSSLSRFIRDFFDESFWNSKIGCTLIIGIAIILPLSLLRDINSLRHTSMIAMISVTYTSLLVFVYGVRKLFTGDITFIGITTSVSKDESVAFLVCGPTFLLTAACSITAFGGHFSMLSVYKSMRNRSVKGMKKIVTRTTFFICTLYLMCAIGGYLAFGGTLQGDILSALPSNFASEVCWVLMVFVLASSSPLMVVACRTAVNSIIFNGKTLTLRRHRLISISIWGSSILISLFVSDISILLAIVGDSAMLTLAFLLPPCFALKLMKMNRNREIKALPETKKSLWTARLILAFGILIGIGAAYSTGVEILEHLNE